MDIYLKPHFNVCDPRSHLLHSIISKYLKRIMDFTIYSIHV